MSRAAAAERLLQRLDWHVVRKLDGLLQGEYRSLFRGPGIDLANLREYQPGDDVRYIDWNVTARLTTPYVREYHEDREITAWFLLDLSPSVDFGTAADGRQKRAVLVDFVTTLARVLTRRGNRIGAIVYGRQVERTIPAGTGRVQVLRLVDDLLRQPIHPRAPATNLSELLEAGHKTIKRRSFVVIASDFISAPGWEKPLNLLARRHELLAVRLVDPREQTLPDVGPVVIEDAETGEQLYVDTGDRAFRARFEAAAREREASIEAAFRRAGVDAVTLSTDDDLVRAIVRMAMRRRQQRPQLEDGRVTFLWPAMLAALVLVPLGVLLAWRIERGRRRSVTSLVGPRPAPGSVAGVARGSSGARAPRAPPAGSRASPDPIAASLAVAGFVVLVVGLARPQASVAIPRIEGTVMLTFDVSGSMAATDVEPSRLDAAKALARTMVERQPAGVVIGVVAFSDAGLAVLDPTGEKAEVLTAIDRLVPTRGTSLGQGILAALDAIQRANADTPAEYYSNRSPEPTASPDPVPAGSRTAAAIVVFSDGENTAPPDPLDGARAAADAGIRIVALGVGTDAGMTLEVEGFRVHTARDEHLLRVLAEGTAGSYLPADDEEAVSSVFGELARELVVRTEDIEVTALFAGLATALFVAAGLVSLLRGGRLP